MCGIITKMCYWPFTCQHWHIGHFYLFIFYLFYVGCVSNRLYVSVVMNSYEFEQFWVSAYVCTKEIYRPQRDSNPAQGTTWDILLSRYCHACAESDVKQYSLTVLVQFSLHVLKGGLKPHSFHFSSAYIYSAYRRILIDCVHVIIFNICLSVYMYIVFIF